MGRLFTSCSDIFPTCPAEMLPTLQLKTWRPPFLTGSDQVRSVMFMTGQFHFKSVWLYSLLGGGVQVPNQDKPGSSSR